MVRLIVGLNFERFIKCINLSELEKVGKHSMHSINYFDCDIQGTTSI